MKISGIYKITNMFDRKMIIGQSKNIFQRWRKHKVALQKNKHENFYLQNAWNRHGETNFHFEIILECPEEKLNAEEIRLIKEHNSTNRNIGYNIELGGNRSPMTEETKRKISQARLGKHYLSEEGKRKIGEASSLRNSGSGNPNYGKHHSKITKAKMRDLKKGKYDGEKGPFWGKHHSEFTKQKLRLSNRKMAGVNHPCYGKQASEETKRKMREAWRKRKASGYKQLVSEENRKNQKLAWIKRKTKLLSSDPEVQLKFPFGYCKSMSSFVLHPAKTFSRSKS